MRLVPLVSSNGFQRIWCADESLGQGTAKVEATGTECQVKPSECRGGCLSKKQAADLTLDVDWWVGGPMAYP